MTTTDYTWIPETVTLDNIIEAVREVASAYPDTEYVKENEWDSCYYNSNEANPFGCLFGAAFRRLNIVVPLHENENDIGTILRGAFGTNADVEENIQWCVVAQEWQDEGDTWADAVYRADQDV